MPRQDTSLEAIGAEFLVLGQLLIERIEASKAYINSPGYDIVATSPDKHKSCRVQVKSRWATDFDRGFLIKNFDCDFVVVVALNRGYKRRKTTVMGDTGRKAPVFYVLPVDVAKAALYSRSTWGKARLRDIENLEQYIDNWDLVKQFLDIAAVAE
jgi:hypothetical protein